MQSFKSLEIGIFTASYGMPTVAVEISVPLANFMPRSVRQLSNRQPDPRLMFSPLVAPCYREPTKYLSASLSILYVLTHHQ